MPDADASGGHRAARAVIVFSAHPWHGMPYGLHHVARALAASGWHVLFVEPPFSPLHLVSGRRRGRTFSRKPRPSGEARVQIFAPFTLMPHQNLPVLRSEKGLDLWHRFCPAGFGEALKGTPFLQPDLVISGSPLFSQLIRPLEARAKAYRLADDDRLFSTVSEALRRRAARDMGEFDLVFATTETLARIAAKQGARRVAIMPNGYDETRFCGAALRAEPADLSSLPRPRVVYAGALESWFDWEAVNHAASRAETVSFVIIGNGKTPARLPTNVHLLGPRPHAAIPAYLGHCDAGIVPFRQDSFEVAMAAIDPIKLWEYLAAGLPVVAFAGLTLPDFPEAVLTYRTPEAFLSQIGRALARGRLVDAPGLADRSWQRIVAAAVRDAGL